VILFATSAEWPDLTDDDRVAVAALDTLGHAVRPAIWDATDPAALADASGDGRVDAVVIRSCWDYHLRAAEFADWVRALAARGVRVLNPPALLLWNLDKRYLRELGAAGVATTPTVWVGRGERASLAAIARREGWRELVVKPAVSASAHETWRVPAAEAAAHEGRFRRLALESDVMVQPYVTAIESGGEWSLVFFDRAYSHAVCKRPRAGDFRVQTQYGGVATVATPPAAALSAARAIVARLPPETLYARVDGVEVDGRFELMELECLDPTLFFLPAPGAAERFARALAARVAD
jgi:glutathione synthase/RimK-type ligase-like ATP-grasp enzyme